MEIYGRMDTSIEMNVDNKLVEVWIRTETSPCVRYKSWSRRNDRVVHPPFLREPDMALVIKAPASDGDHANYLWESAHLYLHKKPIEVVFPYREGGAATRLPDHYIPAQKLVDLLLDIFEATYWRSDYYLLGGFTMCICSRIIDAVNANPFGLYADLSVLPCVPPQIFYQLSNKPATLPKKFRCVYRLVTFPLLYRGNNLLWWGGGGRYLEASSVAALYFVFTNWTFKCNGMPEISFRNEHMRVLRWLHEAGLNINLYDDGSLRIWNCLVMEKRPDLMRYLDVRMGTYLSGYGGKRHVVRPSVPTFNKVTDRSILAPMEPDWRTVPELKEKIDDSTLELLYVIFEMFDETLSDVRFVPLNGANFFFEPDDPFYTTTQGFALEEGYWIGRPIETSEHDESSSYGSSSELDELCQGDHLLR